MPTLPQISEGRSDGEENVFFVNVLAFLFRA
jgi:hypothetical protein